MRYSLFPLLFLLTIHATDPLFVVEIAREGLTTPKNPLLSKSLGLEVKEHNDTLSEYGQQQQYLLGLEMRVRYGDSIFEGKCNPLKIYAYSVNKQSTMLSGQTQLFGICPLGLNENIPIEMLRKALPPFDFPEKERIAAELGLKATPYNFMPLPLHSTYEDPLFGNKRTIPKSELPGSPNERLINEIFKDTLYPFIRRITGKKFKKISKVLDAANEIIWLSKTQNVEAIAGSKVQWAEEFVYQYYTHYWNEQTKIKYASRFMRKLLNKLRDAVVVELNKHHEKKMALSEAEDVLADYDLSQIKYYLFEVGDLQMYTYVNVLDIDFYGYIPPSSILVFELHRMYPLGKGMKLKEAMKRFDLVIKFNDKEVDSTFCKSPCNLSNFYEHLSQFLQ
eukprot:TRINITY_DN12082_c0_g4_i1.p1 TRINITY_DN12082_c0_g4~~TRINITY_DN12082_c0_g4_i1.p1  ORF type:complete len:392 (+),score=110.98 TRINITY_DN12082_c0_g4_i1:855-2030(+)